MTFCGHGELIETEEIRSWLNGVTSALISEGARKFYLGGYGAFDHLAASVLREQKKSHKDLSLVLVLPYLDSKMDARGYDYTVYPPLESVPLRFAISKRNEWMVQESEVVIAFVIHGWGGAAKTLAYARRRKKRIILFPDDARPEK